MSGTEKITCYDIANAMRDLMTMANLSGFVSQTDEGSFRQFKVKSITENADGAVMLLELGEQSFKLTVSLNTDN